MQPGTRVRVIADPGRVGVTTDRQRERAGRVLVQVVFPDITTYIPEDQLEEVEDSSNPLDLLERGRLGRAADLRRHLTFIKLSGRLANVIYSMQTTNTDFYSYQFKPVLKLLESPTNGLLIADEVGLGKTIEAGLIWTELRSRIDARRLLVLCPAMLQEKWRLELRQRFGVEAKITDARDVLRTLRSAETQETYAQFALICSTQGLRPRRGWDEEEEEGQTRDPASVLARYLQSRAYEQPLIDLLVIDEAHYLRNPETMTSRLGYLLRNVAEYIVLLSATPIHLKNQDLYQLLTLVDEDTFSNPYYFDYIVQANAPLVKARDAVMGGHITSEELVALLQEAQFHDFLQSNRQIQALLQNSPTTEELSDRGTRSALAHRLDSLNVWSHVFTRTRKREVTEWRVLREPIAEEITLAPVERRFYEEVTGIVRDFCAQADLRMGFLYVMPQRQMASSMPAALRGWRQREGIDRVQAYEDIGVELEQDKTPVVEEIISRLHELSDLEELWHHDSKFNRLSEMLRQYTTDHPHEKVVLFAYFRLTLDYLHERLGQEGISSIVLKGGQRDNKQEIVDAFRDPKGPRVLLSSEVGSEGIDLQFCRLLINYDLPWNPMRIEQRIGRLDRIGQKAPKITIWNLFAGETIEARIYQRLYGRLKIFERALGELEGILGEQISRLTVDLLRGRLSPEQETAKIDQTAQALENLRQQEERLEQEATNLIAHGDYILNEIRAARRLNRWIDGGDLERYVIDFFGEHYPGCVFKKHHPDHPMYDVQLSVEAKHVLDRFLTEQRLNQFTLLDYNTPHPVRCRFENRVSALEPGKEEVISQFHPLVRFVTHRIRELGVSYHPTVSLRISKNHVPGVRPDTYVFTVQRWVIGGVQDHERLHFSSRSLGTPEVVLGEEESEVLIMNGGTCGKDWLEAANILDLGTAVRQADQCLDWSDQRFDEYVRQLENENNDRADIQEQTLERHLSNQLRKLEEIRQLHLLFDRSSLAKATEGRMRALQEKVERKRLEISDRRRLKHRKEEVCVGLIQVMEV